jgi:hypothetical protein
MIFNSKQLEELENIHDSTGAFEEEGDDEAGFDEVGEAAMDWRRGLIEEAAENIKRAKTRPVEPHIQYPIGSMLFDREEKRFARVQRSVPGYLKIAYLSGGDREYGTLDVVGYLKDQGAEKRLSELAEQLGLPDGDVAHELERLGITPLEEPEAPEAPAEGAAPADAAAAAVVPPPFPKGGAAPKRVEAAEEDEEAEGAAPSGDDEEGPQFPALARAQVPSNGLNGKKPNGKPAVAPPKGAKPAKTPRSSEGAPANAKPAKAPPPAAKPTAPAAKSSGKGVNPIDDPNGYIKANFNEMSNRELARLTGLSEHTIRRKLGEWGLKRKKELV